MLQAMGLEWLYRTLQEPGRLWRRYYDTNTAYAVMLWRAVWTRNHIHP
jgi:N-acetylglucosaminyldiphosphoundecaprenol N-acetyl-beta-D-mannosaminyltransferase